MALDSNLAIDIVSNKALEAFNTNLPQLNSFSTDFSSDAVKKGDTIDFVWTPAGATVNDWVEADGYKTEKPSQLPKTLKIDQRKYVGFEYTDTQLANLTMLKLEAIGAAYGQALAKAVMIDLFGYIKVATFSRSFAKAALDFDSEEVLRLGKVCTQAAWPDAGRSLFVNEDIYTELAIGLMDVAASGGSEALRQGRVPAIGTFGQVFQSTVIPDNGESLTGFANNTEALGIAFRTVTPDRAAGRVMDHKVITNKTGMSLVCKEWYDPQFETTRRIIEARYGRCVGNPDALIRITEPGA